MASKKSAAKSAPGKRTPKHGHGQLLTGGKPGNRGGTGRPPSELRAQLRGSFGERIRTLEFFADGIAPLAEACSKCGHIEKTLGMPVDTSDRLRAIDTLAKYGLGTRDELEVVSPDVQERLAAQAKLIASRKTWAAKDLLAALDGVWM